MLLTQLFVTLFQLPVVISAVRESRPNVVIIVADDLGWNDVSFHGSQQIPTPNIDRLADDGIILNNYYVTPLCSPSRATLLTGRYAIRYGLQHHVIMAGTRSALPLSEKIIPQYLNEMGYTSHAVGKWHLGFFHKDYTPTYRGFESFLGYYNAKNDYFDHHNQEGEKTWDGLDWHWDHNGNLTDVPEAFGQYTTHIISNRTSRLIKEHGYSQGPLFLYVGFQAMHSANPDDPVQAPTDTVYQFPHIWNLQRRKFAAAMTELDRGVGQIRAALEQAGQLDNTFLLFTTDNGGPPNGFNDNWANNWPLRAGKAYFYEGGIRATGFVHFPAKFGPRRGQVSRDLIHISDWLPTILELAGSSPARLTKIDGKSMYGTLGGMTESPRKEFLVNLDPKTGAAGVRRDNFKLLRHPNDIYNEDYNEWFQAPGEYPFTNATVRPDTTPAQIQCDPVPYGLDLECHSALWDDSICLYDVENDPCELYNLVDNELYSDIVVDLLQRVKAYEKQQVPIIFPPVDPQASPLLHNFVWRPWTDSNVIPST